MDERFAAVAKLITQDDPPEWLTEHLVRYAPLIGYRSKLDEDFGLAQALKAIDCIERELLIYAEIQERFDFIEIPDCIDAASTALTELRTFFEEERLPQRKGGPTPDDRRKTLRGRLFGRMARYSRRGAASQQ